MNQWRAKLCLTERRAFARQPGLNLSSTPGLLLSLLGLFAGILSVQAQIDIGSRLELFVDEYLIAESEGMSLQLQQPESQEVVLVTGEPWEGNTCAYYTIFEDQGLYRMYYRGTHYDEVAKRGTHPEVTCYAESRDGIHWIKPRLGLFEFGGSTANNIVWDGVGTHNFTPFRDANPDCPPEARYKALARGRSLRKGDTSSQHGLFIFQSPDGIHWSLMRDEPVITEGAFDSQNLAFWDPVRKEYRDYHRFFSNGVRDILTCTSRDFVNWTDPVPLNYGDAPREHLYTNAIQPYFRAPHLFIGFPTRYLPKGSQVEPVLMTSRDALNFHRWAEPVIPQTAPKDRLGNRSNYMTWGMLHLPHAPREISVYATEAYYTGPDSRLRRFTYRVDGFVALTPEDRTGIVTTKPLVFAGRELLVNARSQKGGSVRVELQTEAGTPIPGFRLQDCEPIVGNEIASQVSWRSGKTPLLLTGVPVRLKFEVTKAEVFSMKFQY